MYHNPPYSVSQEYLSILQQNTDATCNSATTDTKQNPTDSPFQPLYNFQAANSHAVNPPLSPFNNQTRDYYEITRVCTLHTPTFKCILVNTTQARHTCMQSTQLLQLWL